MFSMKTIMLEQIKFRMNTILFCNNKLQHKRIHKTVIQNNVLMVTHGILDVIFL